MRRWIIVKLSPIFYIYIYFSDFSKIFVSFQILQIYTTAAVGDGVWIQPPYGTAVGGDTVFQPLYHKAFVNNTPAWVL
jgi:hypothetical protein